MIRIDRGRSTYKKIYRSIIPRSLRSSDSIFNKTVVVVVVLVIIVVVVVYTVARRCRADRHVPFVSFDRGEQFLPFFFFNYDTTATIESKIARVSLPISLSLSLAFDHGSPLSFNQFN